MTIHNLTESEAVAVSRELHCPKGRWEPWPEYWARITKTVPDTQIERALRLHAARLFEDGKD